MKTYILLAGVNGAGKSTTYQTITKAVPDSVFINADNVLRAHHWDWHSQHANIKAMRLAYQSLLTAMNQGRNIIHETTLASSVNGTLRLVNRAKSLGYRVELQYIGVNSPEIALHRITERVKKGGHGIPEAVVRKRYGISLQRLAELVPEFDAVYLWDNSFNDAKLIFYRDGQEKLSYLSPEYAWVPDVFE